eukprot:m.107377 g.107377  ORF g.107377 m.107377 type:complete len:1229 (-) comp13926_c0_seq3:2125-5811(-)
MPRHKRGGGSQHGSQRSNAAKTGSGGDSGNAVKASEKDGGGHGKSTTQGHDNAAKKQSTEKQVPAEDKPNKEEDQQMTEEAEKELVESWRQEIETRQAQLEELREANLKVARPSPADLKSLDSSVKKNTALVKKLRSSLFENQRTSILNDIKKLNLTKYIPEVAASLAAMAELKNADIQTAVAAASLLHQTYKEFHTPFREALQATLVSYQQNDRKIRINLRFFTQLVVSGVFEDSAISFVAETLEKIVSEDNQEHAYLMIIASFCKHCGGETAGLISRKQRQLAERYNVQLNRKLVFNESVVARINRCLVKYYKSLAAQLTKDHVAWQRMKKKNEIAIELKGELHPDKQAEADARTKAYEKLLSNTTTLSDILDQDMPELPEEEEDEMTSTSIDISNPFRVAEADGTTSHLWEDGETQGFYENLTDLRAHVPEMLFRVKTTDPPPADGGDEAKAESEESKVQDSEEKDEAEEVLDENDNEEEDENDGEQGDDIAPLPEEGDEAWSEGLAPTDPMLILLERLPTCVNRKSIDQLAIDFCALNNKSNRKRLALALFKVKRTRLDLVPFYARLVATLDPGYPDLAEDLVSHLQGEFRFFVRKKIQDNVESKIKNIRFLAELTKFRVCPAKVVLNCLTVLLRTFKYHDIDVACSLLETCGRFLYRSADTHVRTKRLLEIIQNKRTALHLDERQNAIIDNAILYCNPPDTPRLATKVRPPIHEYLRFLLYKQLNVNNVDTTLNTLRKFDWGNKEFHDYAVKCFIRVWKVKFGAMHQFAKLLSGISLYQEALGVKVVDAILEEIRLGMELSLPEFNQRRICTIRFLSELYTFRMVDAKAIFSVLYSLICFKPFDPPDNYFRCKLICTLLDGCGQYFRTGKSKGELNTFLVYFQRYLFTKMQPLPVDTEISVYDTMELLRPKMTLFQTLEEADEAVQEIEQKHREQMAKLNPNKDAQSVPNNQATPEQEQHENEDVEAEGSAESESDGSDGEAEGSDGEQTETEDIEEGDGEKVVFLGEGGEEEYEDDPEDDAFVEEYNKMMSETFEARRNETASAQVQKLDVAIPINLKGGKPKTVGEGPDGSKVMFTLLSRKGNKQEAKSLVVPVDSGLADRMLARQEAELQERERNKQFVMDYEKRALEQEMQDVSREYRPGNKQIAQKSRGRGQPRLTTRLFARGRGRGGPGTGRFKPGTQPAWKANPQDKDFEGSLLRDMGYGKEEGSYKGGEPVFNPE